MRFLGWDNAIPVIVAVIASFSGMYLGWSAKTKEYAKEYRSEGQAVTQLQADTAHIRQSIDSLASDMRLQGQKIDGISISVAKVGESSKSAHERINRLDRIIDKSVAAGGDSSD